MTRTRVAGEEGIKWATLKRMRTMHLALMLSATMMLWPRRESSVQAAMQQDLRKRFSIDEHVTRPRQAEVLRHVCIERLADAI